MKTLVVLDEHLVAMLLALVRSPAALTENHPLRAEAERQLALSLDMLGQAKLAAPKP